MQQAKIGTIHITPRNFDIERTAVFIFSFRKGPVTKLNDSAFKVLKNRCINKRIRGLLVGTFRFLIQNLLNQLLCHKNIKESYLFAAEIEETLDLNNLGKPDGLATVF